MMSDVNQNLDPMAAAMKEQEETAPQTANQSQEAPIAQEPAVPSVPENNISDADMAAAMAEMAAAPAPTPQESSHSNLQNQMAAITDSQEEMIPKAQVVELINLVRDVFGGSTTKGVDEDNLFHEIGELAKFINNAKKELNTVKTGKIADEDIPDASNQLDAIVKMTEAATGRIMDECERMQSVQAVLRDRLINAEPPIDPDVLAGVDDSLDDMGTSITFVYEACNFQDITGQRIQKVVKALQEIERQVLRMVVVFGLAQKEGSLAQEVKDDLLQDADLLNGPQLDGQGLDQDDIDDILNALL